MDLGRAGRGLVYFTLFALLLNGAFIAPLVSDARGLGTACLLAAAGVWIAALYGAVRTSARAERIEDNTQGGR